MLVDADLQRSPRVKVPQHPVGCGGGGGAMLLGLVGAHSSLSIAAGIRSSSSIAGLAAPPWSVEPQARRDCELPGRNDAMLLLLLVMMMEETSLSASREATSDVTVRRTAGFICAHARRMRPDAMPPTANHDSASRHRSSSAAVNTTSVTA